MEERAKGWIASERLDSFDCTLANLAEFVFACLEAAGARSVVEVGAEYGFFTSELLAWAADRDVERIAAIDPEPRQQLLDLAAQHPELELIVQASEAALLDFELTDAVIIDGDHNYFTVSEELRLVAEGAGDQPLPLILLHDIGWPLARRDSYHAPERIPAEHRQPLAEPALLVPGEPGVGDRGLYYRSAAAHEGGPRNGVLTAVEDFIADRSDLKLAILAPFFGLGVIWDTRSPAAESIAEAVAPWDRNPLLIRAEEKRVQHLVAEFAHMQEIDAMRSQDYELQHLLSTMLESSAFALAERLSGLRQGGRPMFSRAQVQAALTRIREDNDLLGEAKRRAAQSNGHAERTQTAAETGDPGLARGTA
jgi:Methyltransferase domain